MQAATPAPLPRCTRSAWQVHRRGARCSPPHDHRRPWRHPLGPRRRPPRRRCPLPRHRLPQLRPPPARRTHPHRRPLDLPRLEPAPARPRHRPHAEGTLAATRDNPGHADHCRNGVRRPARRHPLGHRRLTPRRPHCATARSTSSTTTAPSPTDSTWTTRASSSRAGSSLLPPATAPPHAPRRPRRRHQPGPEAPPVDEPDGRAPPQPQRRQPPVISAALPHPAPAPERPAAATQKARNGRECAATPPRRRRPTPTTSIRRRLAASSSDSPRLTATGFLAELARRRRRQQQQRRPGQRIPLPTGEPAAAERHPAQRADSHHPRHGHRRRCSSWPTTAVRLGDHLPRVLAVLVGQHQLDIIVDVSMGTPAGAGLPRPFTNAPAGDGRPDRRLEPRSGRLDQLAPTATRLARAARRPGSPPTRRWSPSARSRTACSCSTSKPPAPSTGRPRPLRRRPSFERLRSSSRPAPCPRASRLILPDAAPRPRRRRRPRPRRRRRHHGRDASRGRSAGQRPRRPRRRRAAPDLHEARARPGSRSDPGHPSDLHRHRPRHAEPWSADRHHPRTRGPTAWTRSNTLGRRRLRDAAPHASSRLGIAVTPLIAAQLATPTTPASCASSTQARRSPSRPSPRP